MNAVSDAASGAATFARSALAGSLAPLALALGLGLTVLLAPVAASAQTPPAVIRPSATLGPAAPSTGGKAGKAAEGPRGSAQGGAPSPGAASGGPPVFSHRGLPNRYRSVVQGETVLYDAPSDKARKLYIAPAGMPVEIISMLRDWVKFRDSEGDLSWVNRDALTDRRTVVTTAPATLRREPSEAAEPILDADQGVLFELLDGKPTGDFARVRFATGDTGYLPTSSLWGL